jgi:predicted acetyltransferase
MSEVIRRAASDDFERIFHLARAAFPIQPTDREQMERTFKPERNLVYEIDGKIVARAVEVPMGHWFGGKMIPAMGVAGVTVSPEARGRGLGTTLVRRLLEEATEFPLSALYPATIPIYRTLGYGDAFYRNGFSANLSALPQNPDPEITVRELHDDDLPTLIATYDRFAAASNGLMSRDAAWWAERVLTEKHPFRFIAFRGSDCVGWIIYGFEPSKDDWRQDISVRDLVWCDLGAGKSLLSIASLHRSTCKKITWSGPLHEPLFAAQHDHAIELDFSFRAMLRILNVPEALAGRGYQSLIDAEATIRVNDPGTPANDRAWRLAISKGSATVTAADEATAGGTVSIQGLASIYSGALLARDAVRTGSLEADRETILALEAIFAGPTPWLADFF